MFQRISRLFKSWIGFFISFAEDPEVMLQESIEEMRNTMPRLNQILVTTRATVIRLEQEKGDLERRQKQLVGSIQAALRDGSPEARRVAEDDAGTLQQLRQDLEATTEQLMSASQAFENGRLTVDDIRTKLRVRIDQCRKAIQESKKAEVMKKAADALVELDTYGTAATAEKYLEEIKQRAAEAKASVEMATGGLDIEHIKTERKARQLQAQSILGEFEVQMGLKKADATPEAAPFGGAQQQVPAQGQRQGS